MRITRQVRRVSLCNIRQFHWQLVIKLVNSISLHHLRQFHWQQVIDLVKLISLHHLRLHRSYGNRIFTLVVKSQKLLHFLLVSWIAAFALNGLYRPLWHFCRKELIDIFSFILVDQHNLKLSHQANFCRPADFSWSGTSLQFTVVLRSMYALAVHAETAQRTETLGAIWALNAPSVGHP